MKILVAEDEQRAREGLCDLIASLGEKYQIVGSAANGRTALEMIQDLQPDVVFTDIKMPYMSGLELIRAAREQRLETRFILTSAYAEFEYAKEAMKLGCDDYILKPPMREELRKTLDNVEHILKYGSRSEKENSSLEQQYPQAHKLVRRTLQMIESGYKGNLNQQYIAQQLNVSPEYLSYLFARDIGAKDGEVYYRRIQTTQDCHVTDSEKWGSVTDGYLAFDLPPFSSAIICNTDVEDA